ncbi:hypothetical protein KIN20_014288 [Parelaphostrongylus tenuis]|uniref:Uncharacterized protein n=1 Tax=Parelaphostrongylus tenuis TaxID=148309 RepID=A0AAD5MGX6_PARTN|nr:hypothetical protein KIN20_014288 [Parelaphostrongylus tenuis]
MQDILSVKGDTLFQLAPKESRLRAESSTSLQSFDDGSSVLHDNQSPEAFNDSGDILPLYNVKVVGRVAQEMIWHHR